MVCLGEQGLTKLWQSASRASSDRQALGIGGADLAAELADAEVTDAELAFGDPPPCSCGRMEASAPAVVLYTAGSPATS